MLITNPQYCRNKHALEIFIPCFKRKISLGAGKSGVFRRKRVAKSLEKGIKITDTLGILVVSVEKLIFTLEEVNQLLEKMIN
jgi:hypothetical protein